MDAIRPHNPKVAGSNPAPAIGRKPRKSRGFRLFWGADKGTQNGPWGNVSFERRSRRPISWAPRPPAFGRDKYMPLVEKAPDPERDLIWMEGSPRDPDRFSYMRWKIKTIPERLAKDGPVARRIGQQWAVLVQTQWEHNFRPGSQRRPRSRRTMSRSR
jgi:hypothetical protein